MFASVLSLALLVPFARAAVHQVTVGSSNGTLAYSPEAISAEPGDQVVFTFEQKNHTATQSSFANPCAQKDGGFDSGFNPVAPGVTSGFPTYTITVNDTDPVWVFCNQEANTPSSHCGQGMVFAVNCGADGSANSFTDFKNAALAIGASLQANASSTGGAYGGSYGAPTPSDTPSGTGTASSAGSTHTVIVGGNSTLTFSPNEVVAQPNDIVVFQFQTKNHTVTESSFGAPCEKLALTSTSGQVGFDSGFMPVAANATAFPSFSIVVNDTTPIWAYCRQDNPTSHCGEGMVFAINAVDNGPKNFTAFQALAKQINGTSSGTSGSSTTSASSGASRVGASACLGLAVVGAVFMLFL